METLEELSTKGAISLLTLPRSDVASASDQDSLLLLQLPLGWSAADLKGAKFVIPASSDNSQQRKQAALVSDHKQTSFQVQRVETSNTLIMVPPRSASSADTAKQTPESPSSKRAKSICPVPSRLLTRGGAGASFLELRPKSISKATVQQLFYDQKHTFNPLDHETHTNDDKESPCASIHGVSISSLALQLQVSESQVAQAMMLSPTQPPPITSLCYYPLPDTSPTAYAILSEEAYLEAYQAIVAALAETAELADYAQGISASRLIQSALDCFQMYSDDAKTTRGGGIHCLPGGIRGLVSFCVRRLARVHDNPAADSLYTVDEDFILLDVPKVAAIVARQLFQRQKSPWEESLFMARWQAELPGVGQDYTVEPCMLKGVAIRIANHDEENSETYWKYLPADAVSLDAATGFAAIFAIKETWRLEELEPYLDYWADAAGCAHGDLLLMFTRAITQESNGDSIKLITSKR